MSKKLKPTNKKLTLKEQRFITAYIQTGNGAEAVRRAGYQIGSKGGSKTTQQANETIAMIAKENLRKPTIRQAIASRMVKENITKEQVLARLHSLSTDSSKDSDKIKATELLGKYLHLFTDTTEEKPTNITLNLGIQANLSPDSVKGEVIDAKDIED